MNFDTIINKIEGFIYGTDGELPLKRKIYLLLSFSSIVVLLGGLTTNIMLDISILSSIAVSIGILFLSIFYFTARNFPKKKLIVNPLFFSSIVLLTFGWFTNGGYDGNVKTLMMVFFIAIYFIANPKMRIWVFISYLLMFSFSVIVQFIFPNSVLAYESLNQRFYDILISGILYLFLLYYIISIFTNSYESENDKVQIINEELKIKNIEIEESHRKKIENSERLQMALSVSKQGWFDLDILSGKIEGSSNFAIQSGDSNLEFQSNFHDWLESIHKDDLPEVKKAFDFAMKTGEISSMEYRRKIKSDEWMWFRSTGKVTEYSEDGKPKRMIGTHMDINERKTSEATLRESEERYRELINTMPNGFYQSTPDGYFLDANPAYINILGYDSLEELKKVHIPTELYVHETERDEIIYNHEFINLIETYRLKRKDGSIVWLEDNARYIKDNNGNVIYHEGICKDITERKKAEAELLESEAKLKELNATKDKFFSIIAHDLKNPLGNFREVTKLLYESNNQFTEFEKLEFLQMLQNSSENIYSLLNNLLEWSKTQKGAIQFNPIEFDIKMVANNCVDLLSLAAKNKSITLINSIANYWLFADVNLITTVIRNLTSNAIKFTPEGGKIEIGSILNEDKASINIFIKDSGIGMNQERISKLFKIDENISTKGTNNETGTGLGLILCKEFVEIHKGKIWVESEVGKGSTFWFTLPIHKITDN